MKGFFIFLLSFVAVSCSAQIKSVLEFRGDTIRIYKQGGTAELILQNKTKDTTGFLFNVGGGRTEFRRVKKIDSTTYLFGADTILTGANGGKDVIDPNSLVRTSKLYSKVPVLKKLSEMRGIATADLDTGFVYVRNISGRVLNYLYKPNDSSTPDDSLTTIVTGSGKRLQLVFGGELNVKDFGATGDGISDDAPAIQKAINYAGSGTSRGYKIVFPPGQYRMATIVYLPKVVNNSPVIELEMSGATLIQDGTALMFSRIPTNHAEAMTLVSGWQLVINNGVFIGDATIGHNGFDIEATYQWQFNKCHFNFFDTAVVMKFALQPVFNSCQWTQNLNVGVKFYYGDYSGGDPSNDASNVPVFNSCKFYAYDAPDRQAYADIAAYATDQLTLRDPIFEGAHPRYAVIVDHLGSTNITQFICENPWFESTPNFAAHTTYFKFKIAGSTMIMKNVQTIYPDTLFDLTGSTGANKYIFDGFPFWNMGATPFNAGGGGAASGSVLQFKNTIHSSAIRNALFNPSSWVGGYPSMDFGVDGTDPSLGIAYSATSSYFFNPAAYTTDVDSKHFIVNGIIEGQTDNLYGWGGWSAALRRPKYINVGTGGLYLDSTAGLKWGSTKDGYDSKIVRDFAGQIAVRDNSDGLINFKARKFIADSASGYSSYFNISGLGNNDWVTKQHLTDALASFSGSNNFDQTTIINDGINPTHTDTTIYGATKTDIAYLQAQVNAISGGTGINYVKHDATLLDSGTVTSPLKVDTTSGDAKIATQGFVKRQPGIAAPDGTETIVQGTASISVTGDGSAAHPYIVSNTGSPGTNPQKFISILDYGAVADANVVGTEDTARGTDVTPAILAAFAAADGNGGQFVVMPPGKYVMHTNLDTLGRSKRVLFINYGTFYTNKRTPFKLYPYTASLDRKVNDILQPQHMIFNYGHIIGQPNLPSHNRTTYDAGTGPNWSALQGSPFELFNSYGVYIYSNKVSGFKNGIDIISSTNGAAAPGGQQNTFQFQEIDRCANGITMRSLNGDSYQDKWAFSGPFGGEGHIDAGLGIKIDGYSGAAASNGETYNGQFNSPVFQNILLERVDSAISMQADVVEPFFNNFIIEAGSTKGVFGSQVFNIKNTAPNYVRNSTWIGGSYWYSNWMIGAKLGIGGKVFSKPFFTSTGATLISHNASIDQSGNLVLQVLPNISQATLNGLPSTCKFIPSPDAPADDITVSTSAYTFTSGVQSINYNYAGGLATLPSASTSVKQWKYITNISNGNETISGLTYGDNIVKPGKTASIYSNGSIWKRMDDGNDGGSGGDAWEADGVTLGSNVSSINASTLGVSYSFSLSTASQNGSGGFEFTTGTGTLSAGLIATLTYNTTTATASNSFVVLGNASQGAAASSSFYITRSGNTFSLYCSSPLSNSTAYKLYWIAKRR